MSFQREQTSSTQVVGAFIVGVVLQDFFGTLDADFGDASRTVIIAHGLINRGRKQGALEIVRVVFGRLIKIFDCALNVPLVIVGACQVVLCPGKCGIEFDRLLKSTFGFGKSLAH